MAQEGPFFHDGSHTAALCGPALKHFHQIRGNIRKLGNPTLNKNSFLYIHFIVVIILWQNNLLRIILFLMVKSNFLSHLLDLKLSSK